MCPAEMIYAIYRGHYSPNYPSQHALLAICMATVLPNVLKSVYNSIDFNLIVN